MSDLDPLKVTDGGCDLLQSKNGPSHHTQEYETVSSRLVVRRGQPFNLRLHLSRNAEYLTDKIRFEFHIGGSPRTSQKSRIYLNQIDMKAGDSQVGVHFSTVSGGKILDVEVRTSAEMGVGQWTLWMYSKVKSRRETKSLVSNNIVILFNAWNKNDAVYMENDGWRNEYVLNDDGRLYYGTARRIGGMDWYFGQFERKVLEASLKLLFGGKDKLLYRERGDPIVVSRHLSAMVNNNDDNGVLVGNWSGDYEDGKSPVSWNGSFAILEQYLDNDEPVKYGQCWVFSGVLCSVLRSLGIPARSITNFESAHDTDANLTIDYHYDEKYNALTGENNDSVWNFHVWNDVWMARPDLPSGFGGWQALDATPQESSSGVMRCGPMPLAAIKQGMINMDYDGPFIYAEVNGTKRHWRKLPDGEYEEIYSDPSAIGKNISTKKYNNETRDDITNMYKYSEGSPDEILSFKNARKHVKFTKTERKPAKEVVKFEVEIPDNVFIGDSIAVKFKFTNTSKASQELYLGIVGKVMQYNGSVVGRIYNDEIREKIDQDKSKEVSRIIPAEAYIGKARNNDNIKFYVLGGVKGPNDRSPLQTFAYHDSVEIEKPAISVKASPSTLQLGKSCNLTITFTNPLSTPLSPGKLALEGSGIRGVLELDVPKIKAKGKYTKEVKVVPGKTGNRKVIVGYSSPTLSGLKGTVVLKITDPK